MRPSRVWRARAEGPDLRRAARAATPAALAPWLSSVIRNRYLGPGGPARARGRARDDVRVLACARVYRDVQVHVPVDTPSPYLAYGMRLRASLRRDFSKTFNVPSTYTPARGRRAGPGDVDAYARAHAGDDACERGAPCERVSAAAAIARVRAMGYAGSLAAARLPQCGGAAARPSACCVRAGLASAERRRAPQTDQRMTNESVTRRYE